ncbi:hypothetical protein BYT27DRAFT_7168420 [Phlegmacium glaucopus]|nr:hypothetical protein BYT27DRAFT_7168420 [Phlegmacium glaucopus]
MNPLNPDRPVTPESPLTNSLYHATSTIDDLTAALANFSRVPSPEPPTTVACCCGKAICENLKSWLALKSRLGSRLILSAEVGQALLQRHEAYVRQHERKWNINASRYSQHQDNPTTDIQLTNEDLNLELETLTQEKVQLEKLLNQALVNSEVTEVSNKTILQELQDARATITRLTAHHARSIGWDTRLSAALKERDDMQQERDAETHRARLAESRFAVLKDKTAKLQTEVRRLQESLDEKRLSRLESSENILQDARSRIQSFRNSQVGLTAKAEEDELTNVLETLVNDNEILKGDNAELQHLLAESREDLHALQETLEEQRANIMYPSYPSPETPHSRHHHRFSSSSLKDHTDSKLRRRPLSQPFDSRLNSVAQEFSITDTLRSALLLPTGSITPGATSPLSHVSFEVDEYPGNDVDPSEVERRRVHKPLLLLTRSRGTQTETWPGLLCPSPLPSQLSSISPHDPRSESSSFSDSLASHISTILDRILALLNRMSQADALTLTNRLKRQHLKGADVGHLSRSTVSNILSEATGLRAQFRSLLEDDKVVLTCTRKDMRLLFKFVKDVFAEMGQMRVTLNDIILDPSIASRVSELALNPGKTEAETKEREISAQAGAASWMAPISKLFSPAGRTDAAPVDRHATLVPPSIRRATSRPPRFTPKLGPALAASATTVNVEFSGTGRSVTSTFPGQSLPQADSHTDTASGVMGIFAGAPRINAESDPWIVVPPSQRVLRKSRSFRQRTDISTATVGRSTGRKNTNRLSRNVDAVIDVERSQSEESDFVPPLLERTLRRRGMSDSSLHSTFTSQADAIPSPHTPTSPHHPNIPSSRLPPWPDRSSVFQAFSRTVQNIRATAAGTMTPLIGPLGLEVGAESLISPRRRKSVSPTAAAYSPSKDDHTDPPPRPHSPTTKIAHPKPIRIVNPDDKGGVNVLSHLSTWANSNVIFDPVSGSDPFIVSSLRDESYIQRMSHGRVRDELSGARDFF